MVWKKVWSLLKNKFVLTLLFFSVWIWFMDKDDLISQQNLDKQLSQLRKEKLYYEQQIIQVKTDLANLSTNPAKLEKFARERYLMKKSNEDLYVIVREKRPLSSKDSLFKKLTAFFHL